MNQAQTLLSKLSGEHSRWEAREKEIAAQLQALPAGSLLAAAFITYMGPASEDLRAECVSKWRQYILTLFSTIMPRRITDQKEWAFTRFIGSETELVTMKKDGLPSDDLSAENALVVKWTPRYFFIPCHANILGFPS